MNISLEVYEMRLREIKMILQRAEIKTLEFSTEIGEFEMSKSINILQKEISDLVAGIAWMMNEIDFFSDAEKFFHLDVPQFVKSSLPIRTRFGKKGEENEKNNEG